MRIEGIVTFIPYMRGIVDTAANAALYGSNSTLTGIIKTMVSSPRHKCNKSCPAKHFTKTVKRMTQQLGNLNMTK